MYRVFLYDTIPNYWPGKATVYINNGTSVDEYITDENGVPKEVKGSGTNLIFYSTYASFPAAGKVNKLYVDKSDNTIYIWNGSAYEPIINGVSPYSFNERYVKILDENNFTDFSAPHGTAILGTKIFIGTRGGSASRLVCYHDYNDLGTFQYVVFGDKLECMVADATSEKLFVPLSGSKNLIVANIDDITDYTLQAIALPGLMTFTSGSIVGDGTYLYLCPEYPNTVLVKYHMATQTVDSITTLTGFGSPHSATIDLETRFAYFTAGNGHVCKVNIDTLSFTLHTVNTLPLGAITDDTSLIPTSFLPTLNFPLLILTSEGRSTTNSGTAIGCIAINADNMTDHYWLDFMPSWATKFDPVDLMLYNCSLEGYVEKIPIEYLEQTIVSLMSAPYRVGKVGDNMDMYTYVTRSGGVNEMLISDNGDMFITYFTAGDFTGRLKKIELVHVDNPAPTTIELRYRSLGPLADSIQTHTSGTTVTYDDTITLLLVNPATLLATLTITLPRKTHNKKVNFFFGGTIAAGDPVVTALSFSGGTLYGVIPITSALAGDSITLQFDGDLDKWLILYPTSLPASSTIEVGQEETSADATVAVADTTTTLYINPASMLPALDIAFPTSSDNKKIRIIFGGSLAEWETVVEALTFSNGTLYASSTLTEARGGDCLEFQYNDTISKWIRIK